ncbi:MAG: PKD domain-containing protein [Bacteroidia bacterium]|nr:PKD domain-containing protein [Bacteroidia bacterium]
MEKAFPLMHRLWSNLEKDYTLFKTVSVALFLCCCQLISQSAYGQSSNKGTEFWIGFPNHAEGTQAGLYLYITGDSSTSGTVSVPGQNWSTNFSVTANNLTLVAVPSSVAYMNCSDCVEEKGIRVSSQKKVVVYSHIYRRYRSDATLVLPTQTLGKRYYCMSYDQNWSSERSQFMVVAAKDDTKVKITPSVALTKSGGGTRAAGTPFEVTLDAGECYQGRANGSSSTDDVSGTLIEVIDTGSTANCRTVAVFSGSSGTHLGCGGWRTSRDNLYQQMYPTKSWGQRFITVPFKGMKGDDIRFLASEDNTTVTVIHRSGTPTTIYLDKGEYHSLEDVDEEKYILADNPIMVAQYQQSQRCHGNSQGDPSMTILNPIEQTLEKITVYSSEYEDINSHYINVVIPTGGVSSFRIDGSTATFTKVPKAAAYSYAQISVTKGNHQMTADVGFNAIAYGFGSYESYGYAAGANIKDLRAIAKLENSTQNEKQSLCLGQEAEFTGSAEYKAKRWVWDFGDGNGDTVQNPTHTYKDTGTYQVKLYVYKPTSDGCLDYDSTDLEVEVYSMPVAKMSYDPLCEDKSILFSDSSFIPPGETHLFTNWRFEGGSVKYTKDASYTFDTTGKFEVRLIVATQNQCRDTLTDSIYISPNPVAAFTVDNACSIDSSQFTNTSTLSAGAIDIHKWYFGDGDSSDLASPKHFYKDSGMYEVLLTITSDSGCTSSFKDTVFKYADFTIDFTHLDTCVGMDVDFTNISSAEAGTLKNFKWKFPGGVEYTTSNALHQFSTAGTYDVWLIGSLDTVCTDSIMKTVTVDPSVTADFLVSSSCLVDSITFTDNSSVATGSIAQTNWDFDDGLSGSNAVEKVKYASKGSKTVQLIAISDQGCSDTVEQTLDILEPRITGFNKPTFCQDQDGKITASIDLDGDSVVSWSWFVEGTTSTGDSVIFNTPNTGRFEVTLDAVTKNNCTMTHFDSIDVWTIPVSRFTVDPVCFGKDIVPTNLSTIGNGEQIATYRWFLNNTLSSTDQNPSFSNGVLGTNNLRLIVTSPKGCNDSYSEDVEVYPLPEPGYTYADTCFGQTTNFTSTTTISSGTIATQAWKYNDGETAAGSPISRLFPNPGEYSLTLVATSDQGCVDSLSRSITIAPKPTVDISVADAAGCQPFTPDFTNNSSVSTGNIVSYEWDFGDGTERTGLNPGHTYPTPGMYAVTVMAETDAGCRDTFQMPMAIEVLAKPLAAFSFTPVEPSLLNPDITFTNESSVDATTFDWRITNGTTYSTRDVSTTLEPGDYVATLIAIAANGCSDTTEQNIHVKLDFFIHAPTAFSPNKDHVNDLFGMNGMVSEVQGYSMSIFNMWGELIFYSENPLEKWDGTYQGKDVHTGSFPYIVRYRHIETDRWETLNGVVQVIR